MVLGLIDFLLGGKKKTKVVSRTGQVTTPVGGTSGAVPQDGAQVQQQQVQQSGNLPNGTAANPTQNAQNTAPQQQGDTNVADISQQQGGGNSGANKHSLSDVLGKLHGDLKTTTERVTEMVTEIKNLGNTINALNHRVDDLEESRKITEEKFDDIDTNMSKFLSLYELVNNQFNPFVDSQSVLKQKEVVPSEQAKITVTTDGNSAMMSQGSISKSLEAASKATHIDLNASKNDVDSSFLELDTINIEEAAGNAVPLTRLKNNTNSLVVILSWLEYLIKRVGIEETRNTLRYYTEVLRWTTPEVYFDLDKYLRGMKDKKVGSEDTLSVKDHIVSLYYISKLNERVLDERLTDAVRQIIKE
ncbi:hypothetical protein H6501_01040 [Candidatus Woesearchaeota archaeon]|nr:hypothetical protein [Nanoarchaeota archaeon]MCB9370161.1 hypothetical protein [Candidatus Woesearchaeota archaeon]USN44691.1 MAG: hypothetical protein H6500_02515 [Candidatus Woesearchaeota archaeon]